MKNKTQVAFQMFELCIKEAKTFEDIQLMLDVIRFGIENLNGQK